MLGAAKNIPHRSLFDEFAVEHDEDAVGKVGNDSEVMGDQENRHAQLFPEVTEEIENLGLDCHIQGGGGFVRD